MGTGYSDVASLIEIMTIMGTKIERKEDSLIIDPMWGEEYAHAIWKRSTVYELPIISYGSLLGRYGQANGCFRWCDLDHVHRFAFEGL